MSTNIKDPGNMPGVSSKLSNKTGYEKYTVKYYKANMDEPVDMLELSNIETRAIRATPGAEEIVLVDKDKFTFMDKYYIVLKYMERTEL
jgi:hypothetical protein